MIDHNKKSKYGVLNKFFLCPFTITGYCVRVYKYTAVMLFNTSAAAAVSMKKKNQSSSSSDRNLIIQAISLVMLVGSPMVVDGQQPGGATERKREQARQKDLQAVQSKATIRPGGEPIQNICDIQVRKS